jgi:hypothetical protein
MSALEREIVEKFQQLQPAAKQRVRMIIDQQVDAESQLAQTSAFDFAAWQDGIEAVRQQIRDSHAGKLPTMDVVGMLRDIRDGEDE